MQEVSLFTSAIKKIKSDKIYYSSSYCFFNSVILGKNTGIFYKKFNIRLNYVVVVIFVTILTIVIALLYF